MIRSGIQVTIYNGVNRINKSRKLNELREPGRPLCKHDWVGDDDCVYCRNEELEDEIMKTKGMSSLNEDDVRRVVDDRLITAFVALSTNVGKDQFLPAKLRIDLARLIWNTAMLIKQQATDTEPPAT